MTFFFSNFFFLNIVLSHTSYPQRCHNVCPKLPVLSVVCSSVQAALVL